MGWVLHWTALVLLGLPAHLEAHLRSPWPPTTFIQCPRLMPLPCRLPAPPRSNVLLGDDGRIVLTDAGLSALLSSSAPEPGVQAAMLQALVGRAAPAGHAALANDVCSLGELLATVLAPQPGAPPDCPAVRGMPAGLLCPCCGTCEQEASLLCRAT